MSNKQIIADNLTSNGDDLVIETDSRIRNTQDPKESITDLDDNDHISKYQAYQLIPASIFPVFILIEAGAPWPKNLPVSLFPDIAEPRPPVYQTVSKDDVTDTTNGASIIVDYVFTDDTKTVLASINVFTTTSDGTTVDVDTWVRVG